MNSGITPHWQEWNEDKDGLTNAEMLRRSVVWIQRVAQTLTLLQSLIKLSIAPDALPRRFKLLGT